MSISNLELAADMTLRDYFDDVNEVAGVNFSDIDMNSEYYDLESLSSSDLANESFQCKAMHFNIRGVSNKFDEFKNINNKPSSMQC